MPRFHDNALSAHIGAKIRALRITRRLSQTEAADILGVSWQQFQKFEHGRNRISAIALFCLAEKLDVPLRFFLPGTERRSKMPRLSVEALSKVPRRSRSERHALNQAHHATNRLMFPVEHP